MMSRMLLPAVLTITFFAASLSAEDNAASLLPAGTTLPPSTGSAAPAASLLPAGTNLPPSAAAETATAEPEQVKPVPKMSIPFRGVFGTIHAAEISAEKPEFADEDPDGIDCSPYGKETAWGQLIVTIVMGRSLSRFDFVLEWDGKTYPCLAIAAGDNAYSMKKDAWTIIARDRDPKIPIRMLFPLPMKSGGADNFTPGTRSEEMKLVRRELPDQTGRSFQSALPPDSIKFRILPEKTPFLTAKDVQKSGGYYGFTSAEMAEAKTPAAAPAMPAPAPAAQTK